MFFVFFKIPRALIRFFFSSRRRHTRLSGDWSSDVCSSDLRAARACPGPAYRICADFTGSPAGAWRALRSSTCRGRPPPMPLTSVQKRAIAWLIIAGLVLLALLRLGPVLTPFVVAGVLAYALTPVVDWLDRVGRGFVPRWLSALGVELLLIVVLLGLMLLVVPILSKDIPLMRDQVPLLLDRLTGWLGPVLAQFGVKFSFDTASIKAALLDYLNGNTESMLSSLLSSIKVGGSVAVAVIGNAVLIPVALFYLLMDWDRFVAQAVALVPPHLRQAFDSFRIESNTVLGQYLRGQLLVMLVLAIYYSIGLTLFGLELALPVGIFTGLAVFVPYVGFGLGLTLATLAGLLQLLFQPAGAW